MLCTHSGWEQGALRTDKTIECGFASGIRKYGGLDINRGWCTAAKPCSHAARTEQQAAALKVFRNRNDREHFSCIYAMEPLFTLTPQKRGPLLLVFIRIECHAVSSPENRKTLEQQFIPIP